MKPVRGYKKRRDQGYDGSHDAEGRYAASPLAAMAPA